MARTAKPKKATPRKAAGGADIDQILDAALGIIGESGWAAATLPAVAEASATSIADVVEKVGGRYEILQAIGKRATLQALRDASDAGGSQAVRDQLFEIIMARFDALERHKDAVGALMKAVAGDPGLAAFFACTVRHQIQLIADACGVATAGPLGALRVHALAALYLRISRVWLKDESADMAKTMAELDKALERVERWARYLERPLSRGKSSEPDA